MSNLINKDITKIGKNNDGIITSITNVSNEVFIDTKPLNGVCELKSDYFKDDEDFLVLSKGESVQFHITITKDSYYYEDYKHIDSNNRKFYRFSFKNSNGEYEPIFNFENSTNYESLTKLIEIGYDHKQGTNTYDIYINFEPYSLLDNLNKDYVFDKHDIKIEVADKAGHIYECYNEIPIYCFPFDLDNIVPLEISFERQNPSDRYIGDNSIGSVVAIIHNPDNEGEKPSADYLPINVYLDENSIGAIHKRDIIYFYYDEFGSRVYVENPEKIVEVRDNTGLDVKKYEWLEVKIDNIVKTGYVQLYANLYCDDEYKKTIDDKTALNYIEERIEKTSLSFATDGQWVTECPNNKKINLEPFVPMYLKESQYFDFVKFTEDFLNTMFYSNDANCKVGILKKIQDLRSLHDIDELDRIFLNDFAKHFGSALNINEDNLSQLLIIFGDRSKTSYDEEDLTSFIREAYRILPYYNKIKGTDESIKLILSTFGCSCEIIYKWLSKVEGNNELYENIEDIIDKDSYYLSSHFNVDLGIKNYKIEEYIEIITPVKELIFSIKPVSRVFDAFEYTISTNEFLDIDLSKSILTVDDRCGGDDEDIYEKYYDEEGLVYDTFKCSVHVNVRSGSKGYYLYEIEFLDNMSKVGLDNLEKFVSNNGKELIIDLNKISYLDITYVDKKLYLLSDENHQFEEGSHTIACKLLKNSNTYINGVS